MYQFNTNIGTPTMNALAAQLVTAYNRHALHLDRAGWVSDRNVIMAGFKPLCIRYVIKQLNRQLEKKVPVGQPYLGF